MHKKPATYVASVRIDIKDLASIALFYNSLGKHLGTSSKLASEVIHNSAGLLQKNFPVNDVTQAVEILNNLGYADIMKKNARHHKVLIAALSLESQQETKHDDYMDTIKNVMDSKTKVITPDEKEIEKLNKESDNEIKDLRKSMET